MSGLEHSVKKLIKDIQSGIDRRTELYKATSGYLRVVALNYLFNKSEVEDVLNESYMRIWRYLYSCKTEENCYAWLCKIVQRVAYGFNGDRNVTEEINNVLSEKLFYDIEEFETEKTDVMKAIQKLSPLDQKLIYYRFWEDCTYQELARKLDMNRITAYKRIQSILKNLKDILKF